MLFKDELRQPNPKIYFLCIAVCATLPFHNILLNNTTCICLVIETNRTIAGRRPREAMALLERRL